MKPRFEIYGAPGNYRWRFRAGNARIIASGEGYKRFRDAETAVELLMGSSTADVVISRAPTLGRWQIRNPKGLKKGRRR